MQAPNQMISFRDLSLEDMPNMYEWLTNDPEVKQSWGYAHHGSYEEVVSEFVGLVNGEEPTQAYVIMYGEIPIGYIQTFKWSDYPRYEKLGFRIIGTFPDIPGEPGPVHFMSIEREAITPR